MRLDGYRPCSSSSFCPFHMGNRVHPAESLAAYYPWLAKEWHPTKNSLRADEVSRASGREVWWCCPAGHEWAAVVYSRTLSKSACPDCAKAESPAKTKATKQKKALASHEQVEAQIATLMRIEELLGAGEEAF